MKRIGFIAIIETLDEVDEIFWGPTNWDAEAGGVVCTTYTARHVLRLSEYDAKRFSLDFDNDDLLNYWNSLYDANIDMATFDFYTGEECGSLTRSDDDPYLIAAKHIANTGIDKFKIDMANGRDYIAVSFTNLSSGKSFVFKDTVDHCLTCDARRPYFDIINQREIQSTTSELENFITGT